MRTSVSTMSGPKGKAEVFEVSSDGPGTLDIQYEVEFERKVERYPTLGEACIEAQDRVGL